MRPPIDKRNKSNLMSQFVISSYKKFRDIAICDFTKKELEVEKIDLEWYRDITLQGANFSP